MLHSAQQITKRLLALNPGGRLPPMDFEMELANCRLVGRLSSLYSAGQLDYAVGGFHPYRKLNLWIRHLVLNRLEPADVKPVSVWLEREGEGRFGPVVETQRLLRQLIELYRQGLREPLHFYPGSSWAYTESLLTKGDPEAAKLAAWKRWTGNDYQAGEMQKPYHRLLLPGDAMLNDAFREVSLTVFQPLIEHLENPQ
jgi:exodeoxyribonuclease V gamma subunit